MSGRKFRVLHVLDSFDLGGAQEVVANLLACIDRDTFEMEVALDAPAWRLYGTIPHARAEVHSSLSRTRWCHSMFRIYGAS